MSQQIQITGGAKVRNLQDVIIGTSGVLSSLAFDVANGVPKLDSNGKILVSQLPNSVMEYKGTWNAATNTPTLVNGTGNQGDVYLCNVAGTVNFGAGPIAFVVGDQVIYSGSIWQRASGSTGTVTSVAVTESGDSLNITGSPITTSGTINIGFNGTNLQYVNGAGNLTTFPTLMTSVGLTMPSAFTVTNSPLTGAGGTLAVTGAGTTAQYIRGDGSLATFPTIASEAQRLITEVYNSTGATLTKGTVVYINGGQGNLPTVTKAIATGDATSAQTYGIVQADITNMNNGYVVVVGSLMDLDTQAYAAGTQLYLSSTVAGQWTSVKQYAPAHLVYVGIVVRSHPTQGVVEVRIQNGFEMDELHNVSAQSPLNNQGLFYNTSTSLWENKSIATALGYTPADDSLVVHLAGTETISGVKTFSANPSINVAGQASLSILSSTGNSALIFGYVNNVLKGTIDINATEFKFASTINSTYKFQASGLGIASLIFNNTTNYSYTFPAANGTVALTSALADYLPLAGGTLSTTNTSETLRIVNGGTGYALYVQSDAFFQGDLKLQGSLKSISYTYTLPSATGTLALTSALSGMITGSGTTNYLPKFTGASTIGNSAITDDGTNVTINGSAATSKLKIVNPLSGSLYQSGIEFIRTTVSGGSKIESFRDASIGGVGLSFQVTANNTAEVNATYTQAMLLTNTGNLGLGVTPSAWSATLAKAIQVGNLGSSIWSYTTSNTSTPYTFIDNNAYYDGTNNIYIVNNRGAARYQQVNNEHRWEVAPSGTAGNAITFTQAMTLFSTGNLAIGTTTDSGYKLDVNGTGRFSSSLLVTNADQGAARVIIQNTGSGGQAINLVAGNPNVDQTGFSIAYGNTNFLRFTSTGAATFSSSVQADGSGNGFLINQNGGAAGLATYSANSDRAQIAFKYAQNYPASNNYTRVLDIVSTGDATGGGAIRFLTSVNNAAPTERMLITSGGNVGIGTSSPAALLQVVGDVYVGSYHSTNKLCLGADTNDFLQYNSSLDGILMASYGATAFYTGASSSERMRITSGGVMRLNSQATYASLTYEQTIQYSTSVAGIWFGNSFNSNSNVALQLRTSNDGTSVQALTLSSTGAATFSSSVTATSFFESSSIKGKDIIATNPLLALDIDVIKYTRKSDESKDIRYGYSAEQIHSLMPELTDKDVTAVKYLDVHTILISQLQKEIKELKAKMN